MIPRLTEVFHLREMSWDTKEETGLNDGESVQDFLDRMGVEPGQIKVERTDRLVHLSTYGAEHGFRGPKGSPTKLTLRVGLPTLMHGASEYDSEDEYGNTKNPNEDSVTPRISFARTIEGARSGWPMHPTDPLQEDFQSSVAVWVPEGPVEVIVPATKPLPQFAHEDKFDMRNRFYVEDALESKEVWSLKPVKVKLLAVVKPGERFPSKP